MKLFRGKRLYRTEQGSYLFGVCGGLGEFFGVDPNLVRLIAVVLTCCGTVGFWVYLAAAIILPRKSELREKNST